MKAGLTMLPARPVQPAADDADVVAMCSLEAGDGLFGIDTRRIREVLGKRQWQRVPLAPSYVGGMVPYRGEVLTIVSFRALLGLAPSGEESCLLVLDGDEEGERFGLDVDRVGGVVMLERGCFEPNPATLDAVSQALFLGAYRMKTGLLVQLDPERLRPSRLAATGLFGQGTKTLGGTECER